MEYLKEVDDRSSEKNTSTGPASRRPPTTASAFDRPGLHVRAASTPAFNHYQSEQPTRPTERTGLIRSMSTADIEGINDKVEYGGSKPAGGTIMGIHNLAIVFPQFLVSIENRIAWV